MRIDPEDIRRHYAMLSDAALFALNRAELIEMAQACYDEEVARRKAARLHEAQSLEEPSEPFDETDEEPDDLFEIDSGPTPDWLDEASCACTFAVNPNTTYTPELAKARTALRSAGIPCYVTVEQIEVPQNTAPLRSEYCLMVPGGLNLHAASVLDRDLFNAEQEEGWRAHLESLSDEELRKLRPEIFCAGILDRAARLKRAFEEEVARRKANRTPVRRTIVSCFLWSVGQRSSLPAECQNRRAPQRQTSS